MVYPMVLPCSKTLLLIPIIISVLEKTISIFWVRDFGWILSGFSMAVLVYGV